LAGGFTNANAFPRVIAISWEAQQRLYDLTI